MLEKFNILQNINGLETSKRINEIGSLIHGDLGVMVLTRFSNISKLDDLDLSDSNLTDRSAIAIASSGGLKGLFSLNLSGNRITDFWGQSLGRFEKSWSTKKTQFKL